jgi:hypothetical protein
MEVEESEIASKPRSATYRRKALEIFAGGVLLVVILAIARWIEVDVLRKTTNGDGLANLVLVSVVAVLVVAGLLAGAARRGVRVTVERMARRRRDA